ncbi:trypsin-3-like [Ischnura elegans]|uniref:trypsin-3-like n=1 Tax=Ischnura elegans TaxID=197161 RepID=UPI001ED894FA|nr:trypsin-3-like [Ischnura elegans]
MKHIVAILFLGLALSIQGRPNNEPYIIGGVPVEPREFPEMVSIQIDGMPRCGGTILSEGWIMTIAHCMVYDMHDYAVVAGSDNLDKDQGTRHSVNKIIIHQNYSKEDSWRNDIALVSVTPPIKLGSINQAGKLADPSEGINEGDMATVIGYGSNKYEGLPTNVLEKANIAVSNHDQCNTIYNSNFGLNVHDTQLCAGMEGRGFCGFDTGSPLFIKGKVIGISSWTYKCAEPGFPEVFTYVSKYIDWINDNLKP